MDAVLRAAEKVSVLVQREDVEPVRFVAVAVVAAAFALFLALLRICIVIVIFIAVGSESSPSPFFIARPPRPSSTSRRMNVTFFDPHILR